MRTLSFLIFFGLVCGAAAPSRAESQGFSFAVLGCLHVGRCAAADYEGALEKIKTYKPDFLLLLGGMTEPSPGQEAAACRDFQALTKKAGVPVYSAQGTCSLAAPDGPEPKKAASCRTLPERGPYYSFEHKKNLFLVLASQDEAALYTGPQADFIKKELSRTTDYANVFVGLHRSPWLESSGDWDKKMHPLINGRAGCVFGAREHYFSRLKKDAVTYLTVGAPACLADAGSFFPHFLIMDVNDGKISARVVPVSQEGLEQTVTESAPDPERFDPLTHASVLNRLTRTARAGGGQPGQAEFTKRVIDQTGVKPGMSVLDLGAGTGFYTFPFSDALQGTGAVYATEVDPNMVLRIKGTAEKTGRKNVHPVLVSAEGLDPFYLTRTFDIIFLSGVFPVLPEGFMAGLRPALVKDTGRLFVLEPGPKAANFKTFSHKEFGGFRNAVAALKLAGPDFPVFKRLKKTEQAYVAAWDGGDVPSEMRIALTNSLDSMRSSQDFFREVLAYYQAKAGSDWAGLTALGAVFYSTDVDYAGYLVAGTSGGQKETVPGAQEIQGLNKLFLYGFLRVPPEHRERLGPGGWAFRCNFPSKADAIARLEKAGYEFIRDHYSMGKSHYLEFKRKL